MTTGQNETAATPPAQEISVLVVSEDAAFISATSSLLQQAGFRCRKAKDLPETLAAIRHAAPDLVVVEGTFGPWSAASFCNALRIHATCSIIAIDRSGSVIDRIVALELGADDYLSHPVDPRELLTRVKARLRRFSTPLTPPEKTSWNLNIPKRLLTGLNNHRVVLSLAETRILIELLVHAGCQVPNGDYHESSPPMVTSHIQTAVSRLRQKLASAGFARDVIRTIRSKGYAFDPFVAARGSLISATPSEASRRLPKAARGAKKLPPP